jgi:hypothetical protein
MAEPMSDFAALFGWPERLSPAALARAEVERRQAGEDANLAALLAVIGAPSPPPLPALEGEQVAAPAAIEGFPAVAAPQCFVLHGLAGTGKTTVLAHLARRYPGVYLAAPTGKAATVLGRKTGHHAGTLHGLLYTPTVDAETGALIEFTPRFSSGDLADSLVLMDEGSLVDVELAAHLIEAGARVVVAADPGQLPPVERPPYFTTPDLELREIRRQVAGSPIIRQAHAARDGQPYASDGEAFQVIDRSAAVERLDWASVVLCWRNDTRHRKWRVWKQPCPAIPSALPLPLPRNRRICDTMSASKSLMRPVDSRKFQQAEKPAARPRFVQTVAEPDRPKPEPKLTRVAFAVSRLMEFCSVRELQNQTGHSIYDWPLVVAKELFDNALDACEEAEVVPVITVTVEQDRIIVQDNASGIDAATITSILDYNIRVSSREAYVSPTRGAQGNALKTILAMGYVLQGAGGDAIGVTIVETQGLAHRIEFRADHINNQPKIIHMTRRSPIRTGTRFSVHWPAPDMLADSEDKFAELATAYVSFNPHLTVRGTWNGAEFINVTATNPAWQKWRPRDPTSPHWYDAERLQRYLGAHVARDRDLSLRRTVREFIAEFRGLARTARQRQILNEVGCSHQSLAAFFGAEKVNSVGIAQLLAAMQRHSKPVAPKLLGVIGGAHFKERFLASGGAANTFKYQCRQNVDDNAIPYVVEFAFGLHQAGLNGVGTGRQIVTGANWSAAISNPFRRFGNTGEGLESTLAKVRANASQPVICALHLASARIQFADRGKSSIILGDAAEQPDD